MAQMNKPREGNVPGHPVHSERDLPDTKHALDRKIESGLAEPKRDTRTNLSLALRNGWTYEQFKHWCETGETPQPIIKRYVDQKLAEAASVPDDDERIKR